MWTILDVRDSAKGPVQTVTVKRQNSASDGDIFLISVFNNILYIFKGTSSSKNCCEDYNEKAVACLIESGTIHNAWTAGDNEKGSH